jgi:hypothetical protein
VGLTPPKINPDTVLKIVFCVEDRHKNIETEDKHSRLKFPEEALESCKHMLNKGNTFLFLQ